jgi:hypothetical protein
MIVTAYPENPAGYQSRSWTRRVGGGPAGLTVGSRPAKENSGIRPSCTSAGDAPAGAGRRDVENRRLAPS